MAKSGMHRDRRVLRHPDDLDVRPARSRHELRQAFGLVYRSYLARGYVSPNPSSIRFSLFHALPETITFVGVLGDSVIATVSLVPDSPAGLPMDEIYRDEVEALRKQGRRPAEVTMLADRRNEITRTLPMLLNLMKLVFDYATLVANLDDLCITINPRHEEFYGRYLLFTPMGELKSYPSVKDNPALARRLDLRRVREAVVGNELLMDCFLMERTPVSKLTDYYSMTPADLEEFLNEQPDAVQSAPPQVIAHLKKMLPDLPWNKWQPHGLGGHNDHTPAKDAHAGK